MKYTIATIKYILKNFLYIFPFALLPALFLSFSLDKTAIHTLLTNYFTGNPTAIFTDIFHAVSIFNFRSVGVFFAGLIGVVLMILCASLMTALMEKHMRIGKRTFNGVFSKLNDNLMSTCGICLLYVFSLIGSKAAIYVLSVIVFLGMHFILLYIVSIFYLWLPCLQITGFRAFEALRYSYQLVAPVKPRIIFGQLFSMLVAEVLLGVAAVFIPGKIAAIVIAAILYAFMTLMFCVRMQVIYFDRAQLERADLKNYYHF